MGTSLKRFALLMAVIVGLGAAPALCQPAAGYTLNQAMQGLDSTTHSFSKGIPLDWSEHYLLYPNPAPGSEAQYKVQQDPRFWMQQIRRMGVLTDGQQSQVQSASDVSGSSAIGQKKRRQKIKKDWSIPLGATGGVAQGMYPAKYPFSTTQTPSCTDDYAVFPIDAATGNTRAHVVGTFSSSASSTGALTFTVTPTGVTDFNLTLTASTSSNTGTNFEVSTSGGDQDTEASNLAAGINRNLSTTALYRFVAVASGATVTVYALTPGSRLTLSISSQSGIANLSWGSVTAGTNGSQANIVGLNHLYTGSSSTGCIVSNPEFIFSYASGVGPVATSPTISLDGTKIAYVENDTNIGAILHVLTFGSGSTEFGSCPNSGTGPPTCATDPVIPGSTSGSTAADFMLPLGLVANATTGIDTYSSPFINYSNDTGYVGDNKGYLYSISGVFLGTPAPAGSPWPLTVNKGNELTAPTVDVSDTGNILVGDSTGVLYNYTSGGTLEAKLTVGSSTGAGIRDAPMVDSTNGVGYVTAGCNGTDSVVTQFAYSGATLTNKATANLSTVGCGSNLPMYDGTPDNDYFTSGINSGHFIVCYSGSSGNPNLAQYTFTSGTMRTSAQYDINSFDSDNSFAPCSPLTEFYNANLSTPTDYVFFSPDAMQAFSFILPLNSNTQRPATYPNIPSVAGGTSGIIVDNDSRGLPQASSIYFGTLDAATGQCGTTSAYCAVKLTQSGLD